MNRLLAVVLVAGCSAVAFPVVSADEKLPLRVLYLGNNPERTVAFEQFLGEQFSFAAVQTHGAFRPQDLEGIDVVLLDWSQREAYSFNDRGFEVPLEVTGGCPLGDREKWNTPTVLLGSAGHLLAGFWEIAGGSG